MALRGAPLARVPLRNLRLDGESNIIGSVTAGTPIEEALGPGLWMVSCRLDFKMQENSESGQGLGANPVWRFGRQWRPVYVPIGGTKYVVLDADYPSPITTQYYINRVA